MKKIGIIDKLVSKAMSDKDGVAFHRRNEQVVYEVTVDGGRVQMFHYGTKILDLYLPTNEVIMVGGWSASDRDSINTVLDKFGYRERVRLTNVSNGGGWGGRKGDIELVA